MYCVRCGRELEYGTTVCKYCTMDSQNTRQLNNRNGFENNINQAPLFINNNSTDYTANNDADKAITVLLGIVLAIMILVMATMAVLFVNKLSAVDGNGEYELEIDSYTKVTSDNIVRISGKADGGKNGAMLWVNGEMIKNIVKEGTWAVDVELEAGENTIVATISDGNGKSVSRMAVVICNPTVVYPAGTVLVKSDPADVFIRPTASKGEKYVMLIDKSDYTSQFVCVGEEEKDAEGYIWCKVQTPNNGLAWVRSDLMKMK